MKEYSEEEFKIKIEAKRKRDENKKIFCSHCKNETKQTSLFNKIDIEVSENISYSENNGRENKGWSIGARVYTIYQCNGCEKTNVLIGRRFNPWEDDEIIHHYPGGSNRDFPSWITYLGKNYYELMLEIYDSLNSGNIFLPTMGARTLLDYYIVEKIGDIGTFKQKLKKLEDEKIISTTSKTLLELALEYGNATLHRNYKPRTDELNAVLDIIENLLKTEVMKVASDKMHKSLPPKHNR